MNDHVIAIDGPAGAGKSTIARMTADRMDYQYLDTGAMYRALTWLALERKINLDDSQAVVKMAQKANLKIDDNRVFINNQDITTEIRTQPVDQNVSRLAKIGGVRKVMVDHQRRITATGGYVVDGRDIGTRVLPDADLKIFLTASLQERARRRYKQIKGTDREISIAGVKTEIKNRDLIDKNRRESPLRKADDAVLVDTTDKTRQEVVEIILSLMEEVDECG